MAKKLTTEEFIVRSNKIHNFAYRYDNSVYVDNSTKLEVYCPKHNLVFFTTPNNHKRHGCPTCGNEKISDALGQGKEKFIERSKAVFGDNAFDYSKVVYVNARTEVELICRSCRLGFNKIPDLHINSKSGCPHCSRVKAKLESKEKRQNVWIQKALKKYGNKYDLSKVNYVDSLTHIEIGCPVHGFVFQNPVSFINSKNGCSKCYGTQHTTEDALLEFRKTHGDSFEYDMSEYNGYKSNIKIKCKKHDWVIVQAGMHKRGAGCPECGKEINKLYIHQNYVDHINDRFNGISSLYILKCFNETEIFYKVGITCKSIKQRYPKNRMPYKYLVLRNISGEVDFICSLEKQLHRILRSDNKKYRPKIAFGGKHECYKDIPKEIYKLLDSIDKSDQLQLIA